MQGRAARPAVIPCYLFAMEEAGLTEIGLRKGIPREHRDYELLMRLEEAIIRHAKGWDRFLADIPALLRQSIDEVIDAIAAVCD